MLGLQDSAGWFGVDDLVWLAVLFIFLAAIASVFVRRLRKDKCLALLNDHHVTYLNEAGKPLWGDLRVSSQGLQLVYDAPYTTSRGLVKTSCLLYPGELSGCVAICRSVRGLTDQELEQREFQVQRSFDPDLSRRLLRRMRNLVNVVRDAISKTIGLFVGALSRGRAMAEVVQSQRGEVDELGKTLIGLVANAYEPMLERHIGRPVVLELKNPDAADAPTSEFPGYLVDYTEDFVAIFSVDQEPEERIELETSQSIEREGLALELSEKRVRLTCTGSDALVVQRLGSVGTMRDLGVTLIPGCTLDVPRRHGKAVRLEGERTRRIDLVCPRSRALVRFASAPGAERRDDWSGVAPESEESELVTSP